MKNMLKLCDFDDDATGLEQAIEFIKSEFKGKLFTEVIESTGDVKLHWPSTSFYTMKPSSTTLCNTPFAKELLTLGYIWGFTLAQHERSAALNRKNTLRSSLEEGTQKIATELWAEEQYKDYRITEMCELVWSELIQHLEEMPQELRKERKAVLPDSALGLKPWIRKCAPESASRKGRPKKI